MRNLNNENSNMDDLTQIINNVHFVEKIKSSNIFSGKKNPETILLEDSNIIYLIKSYYEHSVEKIQLYRVNENNEIYVSNIIINTHDNKNLFEIFNNCLKQLKSQFN